jgi:glycosyltransferase involved in cell wall biosynthesis
MAKSAVIYNGFSFDRLKNIDNADTIREKFGIKTPFVVGMVASFLNYKDYDTYIKAALKIVESRKDISFLCIGDGDDSDYKKMVRDDAKDNILFLGRQSKVESIMNICEIGVLTTNVNFHGEGISNALMEFMSLGKPVITTNFGGSVELVDENETGYLIDAFNPAQLADRIVYLIDHAQERERVGQNAHRTVEVKFSLENMVRLFREEYINLLK